MAVELILMENVDSLGVVGDKIKVADGYARNYLLPKKLAVFANKSILRQLEVKKEQIRKLEEEQQNKALELAAKINEISLVIPMEADEEEKLFGSVNVSEIAKALQDKESLDLEKKQIKLTSPIKKLGLNEVTIAIFKDVEATLKVLVTKA